MNHVIVALMLVAAPVAPRLAAQGTIDDAQKQADVSLAPVTFSSEEAADHLVELSAGIRYGTQEVCGNATRTMNSRCQRGED